MAQYKKAETETEEPVALLDEKAEVKEQEDLSPGDGDNEIVEKLSSIKDETKAKELREALGEDWILCLVSVVFKQCCLVDFCFCMTVW